jgi:hypothetical protein
MSLVPKRENTVVPQYSLTGDLLSFLRCGLQYRYHNGSSLPPSRPVQLWFGEFIHGVLESAYRIWRADAPPFPWPCNPTPYPPAGVPNRVPHDIGVMGDVIEATLRARGKNPRSSDARDAAYNRARLAVNEIGPHLFPLISQAEQRVIGTRDIRPTGEADGGLRARLYELHGIIDVVSNVQLSSAPTTNLLRAAIQKACPGLAGDFEIIVDYKGSRRPATTHDYWHQGDWQIQTYAWLRTRQPNSIPIAAGILIYINELAPATADLSKLKREIARGGTDVITAPGSQDAYLLSTWTPRASAPAFSLPFRLDRAIRVIPVTEQSQTTATQQFDHVVVDIENCVAAEAAAGAIIQHWAATGDEDSCAACDFRYFCPSPFPHQRGYVVEAPSAP